MPIKAGSPSVPVPGYDVRIPVGTITQAAPKRRLAAQIDAAIAG